MKTTRSNRLLAAVKDYEQIFVVTHDNPDPDAIALGLGFALADPGEGGDTGRA